MVRTAVPMADISVPATDPPTTRLREFEKERRRAISMCPITHSCPRPDCWWARSPDERWIKSSHGAFLDRNCTDIPRKNRAVALGRRGWQPGRWPGRWPGLLAVSRRECRSFEEAKSIERGTNDVGLLGHCSRHSRCRWFALVAANEIGKSGKNTTVGPSCRSRRFGRSGDGVRGCGGYGRPPRPCAGQAGSVGSPVA